VSLATTFSGIRNSVQRPLPFHQLDRRCSFIACVSLCPYTCTRQQLGGGVGAFDALFQSIDLPFSVCQHAAQPGFVIPFPAVRRREKSITSLLGNGSARERQYYDSRLSPFE